LDINVLEIVVLFKLFIFLIQFHQQEAFVFEIGNLFFKKLPPEVPSLRKDLFDECS
jgi:hypothetical protein